MSIKSIVNQLIKKYGTNDPFKLAEYMGVLIVFEPLGNALGYYNKHFRVPIIHINENADRKLQIFICGHELGHYIQHEDINTSFLKKHTLFSTDKIEIEANTFAVELLLPDDLFLEQNDSSFTIYDAIEENGVPKELLSLKTIDGKKILP
ncbi:ImmA/IrrE family metallo-endopeptidase [Lysinibacillus mangiferihumi]|uniref:ImmA/IrrE family metallo-endopeptidase n=1 Tax=Lysinibacillus mangiferihumi TaxID=1130819 RepID=A0A4U2ZD80_9BACI|nr:ImmA/IrrE family metallo-endopeptidase [Lysinibacillus mangiferihumi]TKI72348.1 ImmA/IrrE family metallo-endopeptidase [Lysinibacillus mangiferihumi]